MSLPSPYYQDDSVTLYHGDCRQIVPLLGRFDLLLTDPPYGININKSHRLSTSRGFGGQTWDSSTIEPWLLSLLLTISDAQIIWGGNYYPLPPTRGFLVWDKVNDGRDFAEAEYAWTNLDQVARTFRMRPQGMDGGKVHPTQKPLDLVSWCLTFAPGAATVLDPFAGSGTTGRACKDRGIKCTMVEREESYCEIIANRMGQEVLAL